LYIGIGKTNFVLNNKLSLKNLLLNSTNKYSEFNPVTLKFKSKSHYCALHKRSNNRILKFLGLQKSHRRRQQAPRLSLASDPPSVSMSAAASAITLNSPKQASVSTGAQLKSRLLRADTRHNPLLDNENLIDDLNATCVKCMNQDHNFIKLGPSRERAYNEQPSPMFKYHIGMCSLIFAAILSVLLISDLRK
jgi:hypothetical protein